MPTDTATEQLEGARHEAELAARAMSRAEAKVTEVNDRCRTAAKAAVEAGVPIAEVAKIFSVTRQTVYSWIGAWTRD